MWHERRPEVVRHAAASSWQFSRLRTALRRSARRRRGSRRPPTLIGGRPDCSPRRRGRSHQAVAAQLAEQLLEIGERYALRSDTAASVTARAFRSTHVDHRGHCEPALGGERIGVSYEVPCAEALAIVQDKGDCPYRTIWSTKSPISSLKQFVQRRRSKRSAWPCIAISAVALQLRYQPLEAFVGAARGRAAGGSPARRVVHVAESHRRESIFAACSSRRAWSSR